MGLFAYFVEIYFTYGSKFFNFSTKNSKNIDFTGFIKFSENL